MLHAFLWCPSVNSFKFHTCVHTTPGGECLRHFCSKRVPNACLTVCKNIYNRKQTFISLCLLRKANTKESKRCSAVTTAYISPNERKAPKIKYKAKQKYKKICLNAMHAAKNVKQDTNQKYTLSNTSYAQIKHFRYNEQIVKFATSCNKIT